MSHDFLSVYTAKSLEYLLAVSYLLLFVPFWRYIWSGRSAAVLATSPTVNIESSVAAESAKPSVSPAPTRREVPAPGAGWFEVPAGVWLHPGHTWARVEGDGTVAVGLDDLAHRLVAPQAANVPTLGSRLFQGDPAVELLSGEKSVSAVSPVDGTVVGSTHESAICETRPTSPTTPTVRIGSSR